MTPTQNGALICSYVVNVQYEGKSPFTVGTFAVEKQRTEQETEALAMKEAGPAVKRFWDRHMPDGMIPPHALSIRLGSLVFVPTGNNPEE